MDWNIASEYFRCLYSCSLALCCSCTQPFHITEKSVKIGLYKYCVIMKEFPYTFFTVVSPVVWILHRMCCVLGLREMSVNLTNEVLAEYYRWVLPWWILNAKSHYGDRRQQTLFCLISMLPCLCLLVLVGASFQGLNMFNCHFWVFETPMKWHTVLGRPSPMVCTYVKIFPKESMHFVDKPSRTSPDRELYVEWAPICFLCIWVRQDFCIQEKGGEMNLYLVKNCLLLCWSLNI